MSVHATSSLLPLHQALDAMLARITPLTDTQTVPLTDAFGRITAAPVVSPLAVPAFDNAAMDGYAVRLADLRAGTALPVAGKALAGQPFHGSWPPGTCIRIMTGAPVPAEADAVIMQEQAEAGPEGVRFNGTVKAGQHIRRVGEDIRAGAAVLDAGVRLGCSELPLLASLGISAVSVLRQPRVALFSTGDELCPVGTPLQEGQIYDTNRFAVTLMLRQMGCEVIDLGIVRDDPAALKAAFRAADEQADVVISSGGVSVGEADFTRAILEELGEVAFWKLAIKPGKPFAFGRLQQSWFCGLPGNPVSAVVTFYQLVQPMLAKLMGDQRWSLPAPLTAKTDSALAKRAGRTDFQRGIFYRDAAGEVRVKSAGAQGSHIFSTFTEANCFIVLEQERGNVTAGEEVTITPFNALLGGEA